MPRNDGKIVSSDAWVYVALDPTHPVSFRREIVCIDDCDNCEFHQRGCGERCNRWDSMVCYDCPCLGSRETNHSFKSDLRTVDPVDGLPRSPLPELIALHSLRKKIPPGDVIPLTVTPFSLTARRHKVTQADLPNSKDPIALLKTWTETKVTYLKAMDEVRQSVEYMNALRELLLQQGVTVQPFFSPGEQQPAPQQQPQYQQPQQQIVQQPQNGYTAPPNYAQPQQPQPYIAPEQQPVAATAQQQPFNGQVTSALTSEDVNQAVGLASARGNDHSLFRNRSLPVDHENPAMQRMSRSVNPTPIRGQISDEAWGDTKPELRVNSAQIATIRGESGTVGPTTDQSLSGIVGNKLSGLRGQYNLNR